jgi:Cof subfamily protein (haloacid dehalogenase superfamily)
MSIKLIAIDLDDTLLNPDLTISDANKAALREAAREGVKIVLSSGRNVHSMAKYAADLGINGANDYMICTNGAEILRLPSGEVLYENRMSERLCQEVTEALKPFGLPWQIYEGGRILVSEKNSWTEQDTILTGQPNELIGDPAPWFARGTLKFVVPGEPETIAKAYRALRESFGRRASVLMSKPYFLEILDIKSDKGIALERLAGKLGIERKDVMAIGDALNDVGMVSWAGWGCAVGNAQAEVKAKARLVADRGHDKDAVAWLIRRAWDLDE